MKAVRIKRNWRKDGQVLSSLSVLYIIVSRNAIFEACTWESVELVLKKCYRSTYTQWVFFVVCFFFLSPNIASVLFKKFHG